MPLRPDDLRHTAYSTSQATKCWAAMLIRPDSYLPFFVPTRLLGPLQLHSSLAPRYSRIVRGQPQHATSPRSSIRVHFHCLKARRLPKSHLPASFLHKEEGLAIYHGAMEKYPYQRIESPDAIRILELLPTPTEETHVRFLHSLLSKILQSR